MKQQQGNAAQMFLDNEQLLLLQVSTRIVI